MICSLFLVSQGTSEVVISNIKEPVELEVGDYIQLEIIDLPDYFGRAISEEKYLRYSDYKTSGMRMELTSKGEKMVDGEVVDFAVKTITWDESFTVYFDDIDDDGDGQEDIVSIHILMIEESKGTGDIFAVASDSNTTTIETSETYILNMNMTVNSYEEQTNVWMTNIEHTSKEILDFTGEAPDEIKVGSVWTETETERETGTSKERSCDPDNIDECEWEYDEIDEEVTVTTNYETLSELSDMDTPAGRFDVLEIKQTEEGESSGNYILSYVNELGLPIAMKIYEDNSLTMEAQVKSYKITGIGSLNVDDDTVEEWLPSISFILSLMTVAFVAVRVAGRQS